MSGINVQNWKPTNAHRQKMLAQRAVVELQKTYLADRTLLLKTVCDGRREWFRVARKAFKGFAVSEDALMALWELFVLEAGDNPVEQLDRQLKADICKMKVDKIHGLCRFIESEAHMDRLLNQIDNPDERAAIRDVMVQRLRQTGIIEPLPA